MRRWVWALNPFPAEEVPGRRVTKRHLGSWVPVRHHQIIVAGGLLPVTPNNKHEGHHPSVNCAAEGQRLKQRYMWQGTWITVICFVSLADFFLWGIKEQGNRKWLLLSYRLWGLCWKTWPLSGHFPLTRIWGGEPPPQARCAGFLVVIIYCALNKRCPKENENNVLQQQNMHNKEAIAYGFLGFLTLCSLPPYSFIVSS